jgi:hypothetical protein
MATYFNYVEREADSYVNWADVGRDMSNTIDDIQRVREEKKALIEKTYREDLKFIADNPNGEHESLRAWSLGVANSSAEMMRLQNTLLKQGKLNLNNYLSFRQNITDSVEKIYTVNSQLQEAFKEVNDRSKADANQQLERETKVLLEKYGKLEDTEAYVNPLNGTIYLGLTEIVDEDGKSVRRLKKGDGTYLSPDQLQAAAMQKFDKFDERPVLKTFVDGLGNVNEQIRQIGGEALAGKILSITDVTYDRIIEIADSLPEGQKLTPAQMDQLKKYAKNFEEAETKYIQGILKNPFNASSLLTENGIDKDGKTYNIVFNKADQKTEYDIYVDKTDSKFTPMITEKQNQALTDYLRGQLRVMYDRKVEQASISEPVKQKEPRVQATSAEIEAGGRARTASAMGSYIKDLWTGDMATKQVTLRTLQGEPGVDPRQTYFYTGDDGSVYLHVTKSATVDPTQPSANIRMTQSDGVTPYGNIIDFGRNAASWIYGDATNRQILTQNLPQFENILNANPTFTPFNKKLKEDELWDVKYEVEAEDPLASITKNLPLSVFSKKQGAAATDIQNAIGSLGFKAEATGSFYQPGNYVKITPPEGSDLDPIEFNVNWSDEANQKKMQDDVIKLVRQWYEEQARNKPQPQETPKSDKLNADKRN